MNTKTFHLSGVDKAIYAAATTKFHEAQAPIHKAIMDKVRAALAAQEAEVLAKHRDALSILDLPCYTIQDGKVVEGTVRDHLRLFPQGTHTEPELSAGAFSPELVLRQNIQVGVYEIVYLDEGTETLIAHAETMEALRPVYDSHLLQGILDNPRANIFWVREHAEAAAKEWLVGAPDLLDSLQRLKAWCVALVEGENPAGILTSVSDPVTGRIAIVSLQDHLDQAQTAIDKAQAAQEQYAQHTAPVVLPEPKAPQPQADEAACAQSAATTDGATNEATALPDGSAFAVYSYPLPKGHWLYAPREYEQGAEEPKERAAPILTHAAREQVISAIRYAVRAATDCGKETDFDPDALVQNAVYALCGPFNKNQPQPKADAGDEESEKLLRALYDRGYEDRAKERDYDPLGASEFDAAMCAGAARAKQADAIDTERLDFLTRNIGGASFRKIGVEWAEHADARRAIDAAIAASKEKAK